MTVHTIAHYYVGSRGRKPPRTTQTTMTHTFTDQHTASAYRAAVDAFRDTYADDPLSMLRSGRVDHYTQEIQDRARYLDAWDAWLFTEEAEALLG